MDSESWKQAKGLKRLIHDGVRLGSAFVEKHHRRAAERPFEVLEAIEPIAAPAKAVRTVHGAMLTLTYASIRAVNSATEMVGDWLVEELASAQMATSSNEAMTLAQPEDVSSE